MSNTKAIIRLIRSEEAASAVEFALVAPLLIIAMGVIFETGRAWVIYDRFVTLVDNTARWSARFPEFETRVRTGVPSFVSMAASPLDVASLNLTLRSVKLVGGNFLLAFPAYNFFGSAEDVLWEDKFRGENFKANETAIVISAKYEHKFYFDLFSISSISFQYTLAVNPYFSRSYNYRDGRSDLDHFNVLYK